MNKLISRKIHYKISHSHLYPDSAEKMRNHLAEEMLDADMCNLMKHYKMSLKNGNILNGTIEFLENTSEIIKVFRDQRPILSTNDIRIHKLKSVLQWLRSWKEEVENASVSQKEKEK